MKKTGFEEKPPVYIVQNWLFFINESNIEAELSYANKRANALLKLFFGTLDEATVFIEKNRD